VRALHSSETEKDVVWELFHWRHQISDCFASKLFDLFCKADPVNLVRLGMGFPVHFDMFMEWKEMGEKEFFIRHGIMKQTGRDV